MASLALVPFASTTVLYFLKKPKIRYQITNKREEKDQKFLYGFWFSIHCDKGNILLKEIILVPEGGMIPIKDPESTGDFIYVSFLNSTEGLSIGVKYDEKKRPFPEKHGNVYVLLLESEEKKNKIPITILVDTIIDPFKLGFLSIFQPYYNYRYVARVNIDFERLVREEGYLR